MNILATFEIIKKRNALIKEESLVELQSISDSTETKNTDYVHGLINRMAMADIENSIIESIKPVEPPKGDKSKES